MRTVAYDFSKRLKELNKGFVIISPGQPIITVTWTNCIACQSPRKMHNNLSVRTQKIVQYKYLCSTRRPCRAVPPSVLLKGTLPREDLDLGFS